MKRIEKHVEDRFSWKDRVLRRDPADPKKKKKKNGTNQQKTMLKLSLTSGVFTFQTNNFLIPPTVRAATPVPK